jgi:hypothetical protein
VKTLVGLLSAAATVAVIGVASAADLPRRDPVYKAPKSTAPKS